MADVFIDPTNGRIYWNDNTGTPQSIAIDGNTQDVISFVGYSGSFSPGSTPAQTNVLVSVKDNAGTDALVPGTNAYNLGSSTLRWNTYATSLNLNDFIFTGTGGSFDLSSFIAGSGQSQTINFANSATQVQFNFGAYAGSASTAVFFGSNNSNRMILNTSSSGNVYIQTNQVNARVRLFQNNTTGNVSIFGTGGGTLYLGEDSITNNSDIAIKGSVLTGGGGNVRSGIFTLSTATSNGTGVGGTIQFQTSTSGPAGSTTNALRTRLRLEGAATGTSNLESIIILGDATSGTAWSSYLRGVDASGTDIEAGEIQIQAGRSTGTGIARGISFYVSPSSTTSSAINAATQIGRFASTGLTIYPITASTSTTTGALIVAGGAAVGQTLSIGGSLNIFNGANYSGFRFTGVANTTYTLPTRTPTGTGTSFLSSGIDGVMAWVAAPTGGGSGTINSSTQFNIAYYSGSTTLSGDDVSVGNIFQYKGTNTGLTIAHTDNESAPSATTRLLSVGTGATNFSYRKSLATFITNYAWTDGDLLVLGAGGAGATVRFAVDWTGRVQIGAPGTGFTLPATNGTSGQVLTANTNGIVSWTTPSSSGAGSGTVAIPGNQYQIAAYYFSATGASVSGSTTFTNNTSTGVVRITHTTPSSSTSTGALVVDGSAGIAGSLYVGGQINQTYSPATGAAIDHALFMQSNPVPTSVGSLIQIGSATKWDGATAGFFTGSLNGTYIGINAAAGNTADFINFQQNGIPYFVVGAGGTSIQLGQALDYVASNVLASFKSSVNSYNQVIVQNKSSGSSASADFVINNDQSNDAIYYGNFGMNSSGWAATTSAFNTANAVYLTSTTGPLVLGSTTQHPIRFAVNSNVSDVLFIEGAGTAVSVLTTFDIRSNNKIRFWNAGSSLYTSLGAGNISSTSYDLLLPTAQVGAGASVIMTNSSGQMYFVAPGGGIAFSAVTANTPIIRSKRPLLLQFATGYTPLAAGSDNVVIRVPDNPSDGTSSLTYIPREFFIRVETPSAGSSRIQLEKSTGTGAFTLAATGSSYISGLGLTISGAGIYVTSTTTFAGAFITSGDNLRLNWSLLNATHANFSVQLLLEEV
jgi:hypothetical protein